MKSTKTKYFLHLLCQTSTAGTHSHNTQKICVCVHILHFSLFTYGALMRCQVLQRWHWDNDGEILFCWNICNLLSKSSTAEVCVCVCVCVCEAAIRAFVCAIGGCNKANPLCVSERNIPEMHLLLGNSSSVCSCPLIISFFLPLNQLLINLTKTQSLIPAHVTVHEAYLPFMFM